MKNSRPNFLFRVIDRITSSSFFIVSIACWIGAGLGNYMIGEQWQSEAKVRAPNTAELGNYFSLFNTYHFVNDSQITQNDSNAAANYAFHAFEQNLASPDLQREFLRSQNSVQVMAQASGKLMNQILGKMPFTYDKDEGTLTLSTPNAEMSPSLLAGFIAYANGKTREQLNNDLTLKWKELFTLVKNAAEINLGATAQGAQDWKGKLTLMRTVQPLDDKLIAYHLTQSPSTATRHYKKRMLFLLGGGALGLLLGLIAVYCRKVDAPIRR